MTASPTPVAVNLPLAPTATTEVFDDEYVVQPTAGLVKSDGVGRLCNASGVLRPLRGILVANREACGRRTEDRIHALVTTAPGDCGNRIRWPGAADGQAMVRPSLTRCSHPKLPLCWYRAR